MPWGIQRYRFRVKRIRRPMLFANPIKRLVSSNSTTLFWLSVCAALVVFSGDCQAQVTDSVTAAQAPIPGAGHHYIGMGAETVNPSDGSVSFDLPIQTPAGRGLSFPFGIRYNEEA